MSFIFWSILYVKTTGGPFSEQLAGPNKHEQVGLNMLSIKDMMTTSIITIEASEPVIKAKQIMADKEIRHLPVLENGKVVGLLTDRDLKLAQAVTEDAQFDQHRTAGDICVHNAYSVGPDAPARNVLNYMAQERIGSALVVNEEGTIVGIVTAVDACRAFARFLENQNL